MTLQYFGDLRVPHLQGVHARRATQGDRKVRAHREGQDRIPLAGDRHPRTGNIPHPAGRGATPRASRTSAWNYIELFYHEQGQEDSGYVTESYLQNLAQQVPGLNLPNWSAARNDPGLAEQVTADAQAANLEGFTGTPSFLIGKTGGTLGKLENPPLDRTGRVRSGDQQAARRLRGTPR